MEKLNELEKRSIRALFDYVAMEHYSTVLEYADELRVVARLLKIDSCSFLEQAGIQLDDRIESKAEDANI